MLCKFCANPVGFDFEAFFGQAKVGRAEASKNMGFFGGVCRQDCGGDTATTVFGAVDAAFVKVF